MKLYDGGRAPNPRRVRIFLAEKGIALPTLVPVDMTKMEHRGAAVTAINPWQRLPVLELDDGTVIAESMAICRYFEELHPLPALFGVGPEGRALVEMWNRRMELHLLAAVGSVFRHLHPAMAEWEVPQVPAWGEANKAKAMEQLALLDAQLAGHEFVAGAAFSVADITAGIALDFLKPAKLRVPETMPHVARWYEAVTKRPSWGA